MLLTDILKVGDKIVDPSLGDSYIVTEIKDGVVYCKDYWFDFETINRHFMRRYDFDIENHSFRLSPVSRSSGLDYSKFYYKDMPSQAKGE